MLGPNGDLDLAQSDQVAGLEDDSAKFAASAIALRKGGMGQPME